MQGGGVIRQTGKGSTSPPAIQPVLLVKRRDKVAGSHCGSKTRIVAYKLSEMRHSSQCEAIGHADLQIVPP